MAARRPARLPVPSSRRATAGCATPRASSFGKSAWGRVPSRVPRRSSSFASGASGPRGRRGPSRYPDSSRTRRPDEAPGPLPWAEGAPPGDGAVAGPGGLPHGRGRSGAWFRPRDGIWNGRSEGHAPPSVRRRRRPGVDPSSAGLLGMPFSSVDAEAAPPRRLRRPSPPAVGAGIIRESRTGPDNAGRGVSCRTEA